jgi:hypothetical protein
MVNMSCASVCANTLENKLLSIEGVLSSGQWRPKELGHVGTERGQLLRLKCGNEIRWNHALRHVQEEAPLKDGCYIRMQSQPLIITH